MCILQWLKLSIQRILFGECRALVIKVRNINHDENHYALFANISDYVKNSFGENSSELLEKVVCYVKLDIQAYT
jgi:hypothetical protein